MSRSSVRIRSRALKFSEQASTAATRYRNLKQFFRWLEVEGEVEVSPMARMRPAHGPRAARAGALGRRAAPVAGALRRQLVRAATRHRHRPLPAAASPAPDGVAAVAVARCQGPPHRLARGRAARAPLAQGWAQSYPSPPAPSHVPTPGWHRGTTRATSCTWQAGAPADAQPLAPQGRRTGPRGSPPPSFTAGIRRRRFPATSQEHRWQPFFREDGALSARALTRSDPSLGAIRLATYNAESAMARRLGGHHARTEDEGRALLREIYSSPPTLRSSVASCTSRSTRSPHPAAPRRSQHCARSSTPPRRRTPARTSRSSTVPRPPEARQHPRQILLVCPESWISAHDPLHSPCIPGGSTNFCGPLDACHSIHREAGPTSHVGDAGMGPDSSCSSGSSWS